MNKKNYGKGYRHEIMRLLFLNGVITYKSLRVIPYRRDILSRVVKKMEDEGVIEIYADPKRVLLKMHTSRTLGNMPAEWLEGITKEQQEYYKTEIAGSIRYLKKDFSGFSGKTQGECTRRSVRAIRESEINVMMYAIGAFDFPDSAKRFLQENGSTYYTSKQMRGEECVNIVQYAARVHGMLATPGGCYMMYHTGNAVLQLNPSTETWAAIQAHRYLMKITGEDLFGSDHISDAVVLADNPIILAKMIKYDKKRQNFKNIVVTMQDIYQSCYGVVNDVYGRKMMSLMQMRGWKNYIRSAIIPKEETQAAQFCTVPCDGYNTERDIYTLLFCIPDLIKLRIFTIKAAMEKKPGKFQVICFAHQLPTIANTVAKDSCKVLSIPFEKFEERMGLI